MNLFPTLRLATPAVFCAGLIACAGPNESATPVVVRTPPPQKYESTISNYLAFRVRNPQKNTELSFGQPEPGACALDGYVTGRRGWVVPVSQATRTPEATGKETMRIDIKQYYFWFLGDTIAGITPRVELCPGMEPTMIDSAPRSAAVGGFVTTPTAAATDPRVDAAEAAKRDRAKGATGQKSKAAQKSKKTGSPATATKAGGAAVSPAGSVSTDTK
jgi:hypothetical protein